MADTWTPNDVAPLTLGQPFETPASAGAWTPHDTVVYSDTFAAPASAWAQQDWSCMLGFIMAAESGGAPDNPIPRRLLMLGA